MKNLHPVSTLAGRQSSYGGSRRMLLATGVLVLIGLVAAGQRARAQETMFFKNGDPTWDSTSASWLYGPTQTYQEWIPGSRAQFLLPTTVTVVGQQVAEWVILPAGSVLNASAGSQIEASAILVLDSGQPSATTTNFNPLISSTGIFFITPDLSRQLILRGAISTGTSAFAASSGSVIVRGTTATGGTLFVDGGSNGSITELTFDGGATGTFSSGAEIAYAAGRPGTLAVNGTGSSVTVAGIMNVGRQSNGTLRLDGGSLTAAGGIDTAGAGATTNIIVNNGGTLSVGGAGIRTFGGAASINMTNGGTYKLLSDHNVPLNVVLNSGLAGANRIDTNGHNGTFSGNIAGGQLEKRGAGILKVTGANSYGNPSDFFATVIKEGLIEFSTLSNLNFILNAQNNPIRLAQLDGGGLRWAAGNTLDISRWARVTAGGGTYDTNGNDVLFATSVGYGGTVITQATEPITKAGAGTLTLAAVVTNRKATTNVTGGKLAIANINHIGAGPVNMSTGGQLEVAENFSLNNQITVDGAGSAANVSGFLELAFGSSTTGGLTVTSGGSANAGSSIAAGILGGTGIISVTGAGSSATTNGIIYSGVAGTGIITVANGGTITASSLRFADGGGEGTFNLNTGGTLAVGGMDGISKGPGTATFNFAGGTLRVNGSNLTSALPLTLTNASAMNTNNFNATLAGALTGPGSLTKTGPGVLTLNGANTFAGGLNVEQGTVAISANGRVGTGPMSITGGGKLDGGAANLFFSQHLSVDGAASSFSTTGGVEFGTNPTTVSISNGASFTTGVSAAFGLFPGVSNASVTGAGSSMNLGTVLFLGAFGGSGSVAVGNGGTVNAARVIFGAGTGTGAFHLNSGGLLNVGGGPDAIAVDAGATASLNFGGGTLRMTGADFAGNVPMTVSAPSSIDTNSFNATLGGALIGSGSITKVGPGTLNLTGNSSIGGIAVVNGGTLAFSSGGLSVGTYIEVGSSGSGGLSVTGNADVSSATSIAFGVQPGVSGGGSVTGIGSTLSAGGTLFVGYLGSAGMNVGAGGTVMAGALTLGAQAGSSGVFDLNIGGALNVGGTDGISKGAGTATFNLAGGLLKVTNSSLTTSVPMILANQSTIDTSGVTATLSGVLSDAGGIIKTGGGTLFLTAANAYAGGTTVQGGQISVTSAVSLGVGPVTVVGGSIGAGTYTRNASTTVDGPSSLLSASSDIEIGSSGQGSLAITGGGVVSTPSTVALGVLAGDAGSGAVTGSGSTLSAGSALFVGFLGSAGMNVGAGGSVTVGALTIGSQLGSSGVFDLNLGGTLNVGGTDGITKGAGTATFNFAGGLLKVTNSSLTTSVPMTLTNTSTVDTSGVTATLSGALSGTGGLVKTGGGTLTLGAVNSYAGATTLLGGTLALGISGALPDASPISLLGGILDTNGFSDAAGTLQLGISTTIDFDSGISSLAFANSSSLAWTGTLTITGFTEGGDSLRFGTDASGLSASQLASIRFAEYGNAAGVIDANGFVSIPEPGAGVLLLGGCVLLARIRRRD